MAKKCMQYREQRRKYQVRVRNRCKVCGRPRAYYSSLWSMPYLLPRNGITGRNSRCCEIKLVGGCCCVQCDKRSNCGHVNPCA